MKILTISLIFLAIWIIFFVFLICKHLTKKIKTLEKENAQLREENNVLIKHRKFY